METTKFSLYPQSSTRTILGKVSSDTKNILVEVTGTNVNTVGNTLKIVVAALAERSERSTVALRITRIRARSQ